MKDISSEIAVASTSSEEPLNAPQGNKITLLSKGQCEEHSMPNHFNCQDCNKYICGTCAFLKHKSCQNVLPIVDALNLKKEEKLRMIKVFKKKVKRDAKLLGYKLDCLNRKQEKLNQEIENVKAEVEETKSKIERNQKLNQESSGFKENLEKGTFNDDYDELDAKVKIFIDENSFNRPLSPPSILSKVEAMKLTMKDLQEKIFFVTKNDNEEKKYAHVMVVDDQIHFDEWEDEIEGGSSCVDLLDFIGSRTTVVDTHKFIEEHKNELHNPKLPELRNKFSKIEVNETGIYFYSFKNSKRSDFNFEFGGLLKTLGCYSVSYAEAFLKIQSYSREEVVISTDSPSPRALNFLLLASGIMDDSYQGTTIMKNNLSADGGYKKRGRLLPCVVEGIQDEGIYERKESKRGDVNGWFANNPKSLSYFRVWKKGNNSAPSKTTFGRVKRGMEVVDQLVNDDIVKECGLIFDLPGSVVSKAKRIRKDNSSS